MFKMESFVFSWMNIFFVDFFFAKLHKVHFVAKYNILDFVICINIQLSYLCIKAKKCIFFVRVWVFWPRRSRGLNTGKDKSYFTLSLKNHGSTCFSINIMPQSGNFFATWNKVLFLFCVDNKNFNKLNSTTEISVVH
jgi:hypothetical protein